MDGGTGSEIQRRGVDVLRGATIDKLKAWSATANITDADVVQQVHQDYLRVGADIIISNNFWTIPSAMDLIGLRDQWREYAAAAADNAMKARANGNPRRLRCWRHCCADHGCAYGQRGLGRRADGGRSSTVAEFVEPAQVLVEAGADMILPEYVGYIEDCVAAVDACAEAGAPVLSGRQACPAGRPDAVRREPGRSCSRVEGPPGGRCIAHVHRARVRVGRTADPQRRLRRSRWRLPRTSATTRPGRLPRNRSPKGRVRTFF